MSLETAAGIVADKIRRQEFVEVFAHHDADGIAAASILCHAMLRAGIRFRLRVRQEIAVSGLPDDAACLLCDLGAGMEDLPRDVMVVDHHLPLFTGEFHVNPRLCGIDGDRELSAAGTAYYVALKMGDNRDLAGLVIPGIIGDGQQMTGKNLEIFNEGIANGIIEPGRGITLPGRDMTERWYMATNPYLDGISGAEERIEAILGMSRDPAQPGNGHGLETLLSQVVLEAAPKTSAASLLAVWGDTYHLQREVIEDAHALTAVIDACGKTGSGDIAATLCLRSSAYVDRAWEIARQHRSNVIGAVRTAKPVGDSTGIYEIESATLASDVADILARDIPHAQPVLVYAKSGDSCRISVRCPPGMTADLGPIVRALAGSCGGRGGGHLLRAGATIPCDKVGMFAKGWQEAIAA
ncbi:MULTISPECIES: DHH family phosphoesterase [unclassified Methanoregula]|uniref:DHH family phosphoesterase n=1 Tax=unclassified Methanoregula TaxID=2649730 RepID=UPI0009C7B67B|nr:MULTISPECIES: DHH family phosphoesterase [unclassified Methanoregula]OPX64069.1 MAG: DHHA1 domain protein [Methanoregula sp. PtaB.Bin085]OPY33733.1 MAG: DHHA1 domain protein [Methanoregula sp. PtaU1.Bin006]